MIIGRDNNDSEKQPDEINLLALYELRRRRLRQLIVEVWQGERSRLAKAIGRHPSYISLLTTENPKHWRPLRETLARVIETASNKPLGWLDQQTESDVLLADGMKDLANMLDTKSAEIRKKNLLSLMSLYDSVRTFANDALVPHSLVQRIAAGVDKMNDATARRIEQSLGKFRGWMDFDHQRPLIQDEIRVLNLMREAQDERARDNILSAVEGSAAAAILERSKPETKPETNPEITKRSTIGTRTTKKKKRAN